MGGKNFNLSTNTNIWELYWILSSHMTKGLFTWLFE